MADPRNLHPTDSLALEEAMAAWPGKPGTNGTAGEHYVINWPRALFASLVASAVITLYMLTAPRILGIEQMDHGLVLGAALVPSGGPAAFLVRIAWHVVNGMLYVPMYVAVVAALGKQSTVWTGAVFGVALWLVGPMLLIPVLLNLISAAGSGELANPGIFMQNLGLGVLPCFVDLGAHLAHGLVAGALYKHALRSKS